MNTMTAEIIETVARNIRQTGSYELYITTGKCLQMMGYWDENMKNENLYLVHMGSKDKVKNYYHLKV